VTGVVPVIRIRFQVKPAALLIPITFSLPCGGRVLRYPVPKRLLILVYRAAVYSNARFKKFDSIIPQCEQCEGGNTWCNKHNSSSREGPLASELHMHACAHAYVRVRVHVKGLKAPYWEAFGAYIAAL